MNEIKTIDIPQIVKIRKHHINNIELCEFLRTYKKQSKLNNNQIAEILDIPKTNVEHWFRKDNCFSIPDAEIWFKIKDLFGINTNEYDAAVTEFNYEIGKFDMGNRHYLDTGISPTITCGCGDVKVVITSG